MSQGIFDKLEKMKLSLNGEHYIKFGLNPNGDFVLLENFSNHRQLDTFASSNKEFNWVVQFTINKIDFDKLDDEEIKYIENLRKFILDWRSVNWESERDTLSFAGLQMTTYGFISYVFEKYLQENKIDYIKSYNVFDYKNELGIHEVLEKIYATEDHQIHMGISPIGNMIFDENFCNTTSYLQEPDENEELEWSVRFIINKNIWDKLDIKTKNLVLDYKKKTEKKYEDYYNNFPAGPQLNYMDDQKEFISNEYELTLQKLDIAYTKRNMNHNRSVVRDLI